MTGLAGGERAAAASGRDIPGAAGPAVPGAALARSGTLERACVLY